MLGIYELSSGRITGIVFDIKHIFSAALKANDTAFMIIHNQPSGRAIASEADRKITRKVTQTGQFLDIALI